MTSARASSIPSVHPDTCGVISTLPSSWNGRRDGSVGPAPVGVPVPDVQDRSGDRASPEGLVERLLVDDLGPRATFHDDRGRLHQSKLTLAENPASLGRERRGHDQVVGAPQELDPGPLGRRESPPCRRPAASDRAGWPRMAMSNARARRARACPIRPYPRMPRVLPGELGSEGGRRRARGPLGIPLTPAQEGIRAAETAGFHARIAPITNSAMPTSWP